MNAAYSTVKVVGLHNIEAINQMIYSEYTFDSMLCIGPTIHIDENVVFEMLLST